MIEHIPLEIEPPQPMPSPPLRRHPYPMPQFSMTNQVASTSSFLPIFD
jgi:hypothetical protein